MQASEERVKRELEGQAPHRDHHQPSITTTRSHRSYHNHQPTIHLVLQSFAHTSPTTSIHSLHPTLDSRIPSPLPQFLTPLFVPLLASIAQGALNYTHASVPFTSLKPTCEHINPTTNRPSRALSPQTNNRPHRPLSLCISRRHSHRARTSPLDYTCQHSARVGQSIVSCYDSTIIEAPAPTSAVLDIRSRQNTTNTSINNADGQL